MKLLSVYAVFILLLLAGISLSFKANNKLEDELLKIASTYKDSLTVNDDRLKIAPQLCAPLAIYKDEDIGYKESQSGDDETHGKKLYLLYEKRFGNNPLQNYQTYQVQPLGQVLVKESFTMGAPVEVDAANTKTCLIKNNKAYCPDEKRELFIMYKPKQPNYATDSGWVYGIVTADGKKIIGAGLISSCMGCHTKSTHDRMLGM
jgi:hypothetical protein